MNRQPDSDWLHDELTNIAADYEQTVQGLWGVTAGGTLRSVKGSLVERLARKLAAIASQQSETVGVPLEFRKGKHRIPMNPEYISRIPYVAVRQHVLENFDDYSYGLGCDVQCYYGDEFRLSIECKAYTEVAMLKRILVDSSLLKGVYPSLRFALFQLESQLGGDYSELSHPPMGSTSAHTVMSNFGVNIEVITLLAGERNVQRPIHKEEYYKPLTIPALETAVEQLVRLLTA